MTNKGGRPKKEITKDIFEELCNIQCTKDEIASVFRCNESTISRFCYREYDESFAEVYKKLSEDGKTSLRRTQFHLAQKNTAMAIWLGKQYLGQSDRQEVTNITPDTEIKIEIINDKNQLKPKKNEP